MWSNIQYGEKLHQHEPTCSTMAVAGTGKCFGGGGGYTAVLYSNQSQRSNNMFFFIAVREEQRLKREARRKERLGVHQRLDEGIRLKGEPIWTVVCPCLYAVLSSFPIRLLLVQPKKRL